MTAKCRLGNERWMNALPWSNATQFNLAPEKTWTVNGTEAGTVRTASGFSMVKVSGAGHMVSPPPPHPNPRLLPYYLPYTCSLPLPARTSASCSSYSWKTPSI